MDAARAAAVPDLPQAPWALLIDPDHEVGALLAMLLAPAYRVAVAACAAAAEALLDARAPALLAAHAGGSRLPPVLLFCGALPDPDSARLAGLVLLKPGISRRHLRLTLNGMLNAGMAVQAQAACGAKAPAARAAPHAQGA
ncbi:hypothetical protein [Massilia pseudoviolaceinigra]|uniref:hypothetical protein n=1 Tax=Massilia pseudoviolaceinigra TaxID=3057165 RepID=UPI00279694B6|nr:hypothetical protein [Massilia sp. CCM 9206]MDQ1922939.1 hypothetical protein [Massilia sp. CCM 9206]